MEYFKDTLKGRSLKFKPDEVIGKIYGFRTTRRRYHE